VQTGSPSGIPGNSPDYLPLVGGAGAAGATGQSGPTGLAGATGAT
jgi:hypothetical protein